LSGYGLYISSANRQNKGIGKRILLLWLNYLIILIVFIGIGSFIRPDKYPGNFSEIISNTFTWTSSYNSKWWFLFPYLMLVLLSKFLFSLFNSVHSVIVFIILGCIYAATYMIIFYNKSYLYNHELLYKPVLILNLLFSFGTGALFAKERVFQTVGRYIHLNSWLIWLFIILLTALRMILSVAIFNPLFAFLFILCFFMLKRSIAVNEILAILGKHSTNMWLIHSFFCYYLFKDFIYSFKYPVIIFIVLLIISLISSFLINLIYKPISAKLSQWIN
jgi:hypothetical protein